MYGHLRAAAGAAACMHVYTAGVQAAEEEAAQLELSVHAKLMVCAYFHENALPREDLLATYA